jgi:hypothetical protein
MKKIPGFLLLFFIAFQPGCNKKNNDTVLEVIAHLRYGGEPAADGTGYYLLLDSTREYVIPINLPSTYRHPDVNETVAVRLIDVGKRFFYGYRMPGGPGFRGVYIATIRSL